MSGAKLLAELDRSVLEIAGRVEYYVEDQLFLPFVREAIEKQDDIILDHNVALEPQWSASLFGGPSACFELRKINGHFIERSYVTMLLNDDQLFDLERLVPVDGAESLFHCAFRPIKAVSQTNSKQ